MGPMDPREALESVVTGSVTSVLNLASSATSAFVQIAHLKSIAEDLEKRLDDVISDLAKSEDTDQRHMAKQFKRQKLELHSDEARQKTKAHERYMNLTEGLIQISDAVTGAFDIHRPNEAVPQAQTRQHSAYTEKYCGRWNEYYSNDPRDTSSWDEWDEWDDMMTGI
ncbi:uncharacterized protein LY89DRAFT_712744 [Mollisia scopiformis]|uniref:Uncharacterized protein n=1 Tax=Mollisia scopiformis TaxID=149040 RepID=A0A194XUB0_MOLSC|nr:uncharacterized protein LY89DRAFT_712744 [Mollisia scopiformis]KUJ23726.1 hypothetical protein LY89DRAFT_712744 [Mollisia scopiformis]